MLLSFFMNATNEENLSEIDLGEWLEGVCPCCGCSLDESGNCVYDTHGI